MRKPAIPLCGLILPAIAFLSTGAVAMGQSAETVSVNPLVVPQVVKYGGVIPERAGDAVEAVFRIYPAIEGGEALWTETQRLRVGQDGGYTVLLGAASEGGLPQTTFSSGQARWLGISIEGAPEMPRVPLVSVAYAMKAADAETLGGVPAREFVTQAQLRTGPKEAESPATVSGKAPAAVHPNTAPTGSGTANTIAMWTGASTLGNSALTQSGANVTAAGSLTGQSKVTTAAVTGTNTSATGQAFGVRGTVAGTGTNSAGVSGFASATTGEVFGVQGTANSTAGNAAGVAGYEGAATGVVFGLNGTAASSTALAAGVGGYESSTTGQVYGVSGRTSSITTNAAGVNGSENAAIGQVYGVNGAAYSKTSYAAGVNGYEGSTTGVVYGVEGSTSSTTPNAAGVNGFEGATTGQVYGLNGATNSATAYAAGVNGYEGATTGQVFGVSGSTSSTTSGAAGVSGAANGLSGQVYGVIGTSNSSGGAGVFGKSIGTTGNSNGVFGTITSSSGNGVLGANNATFGFAVGVTGYSASSGGAGVQGYNTATSGGIGVLGTAPTQGTAIQGTTQVCSSGGCAPAKGTAGSFETAVGGTILLGTSGPQYVTQFRVDSAGNGFYAGNLNVTGKLTKGSGSFKIDHPLDPANMYLSHSFVESPDMMNVYNGNITTDKHGLATVTLPDYFEALNRDFRYQLTVIGQFAQAIVAHEIDKNHFTIRTSKPGVKVSWQVTGIRQDAYANANRIPVEETKPPAEQGYYLHPELFGQPPGKALSAAARPAPSQEGAQGESR